MTGRHHILFLLIAALLLMMVNAVSAQRTQKIVNDFRKLEQYVKRVADLTQTFQDEQARQFIVRAFDNLESARRYLFVESPPRPTLAQLHMLAAKKNTDQAAKIVLRKPLTYLKSQLDEKINQAERAVTASGSDEAHYLLNQAKKYRLWSYSSFLAGNLVRGQEYFRISYFFAQKCLEFVSGAGKDLNMRIEDLEANIRQLLIEAEELARNSDNPQFIPLIEDANRYFEEALQFAENGDLQIAFRRLQLVKRLLYRIFDMADRDDDNVKARMENNLYSLRSFLQSLTEDAVESTSPQVRNMLDQAWALYRQAEQSFEQGDYQAVKSKSTICQRLANRILQLLRRSERTDLSELKQRADETQQLLRLIEDRVDFSDKPYLRAVFEEAQRLLNLAYQAIEDGQSVRAFQYTQAATRLTARIQREIQQTRDNLQEAQLRRTYERLQNMIQRLQNSGDVPDEYTGVLEQLMEFLDKAREYLEQGNFVLAEEYLSTVNEQLKQITSRWQKK